MKKLLIALALLVAAAAAHAQQAAPPAGPAPTGLVVGSGNYFSPIVADLDKAVAFYRDGIGFEVQGEPANADTNPQLRGMFGLPDARLRWLIGRAPPIAGGVEIVEVSKASGKPVRRRVQDPGAITLVATVRDLDATFARVKKLGAPVVTRSGAPVKLSVGRMVVVQDPAGHFVEIVQPDQLTSTQAAATTNVVGVRVRFTVRDVATSLRLYRDALGFRQVGSAGEYREDAAVLDVLGLSRGQYRVETLEVPTSGLQFTLIDFRGVDRQTIRAGIEDPGSTRIQLRVADINAAVAALSKAGGAFVSTGGKPLDLPAGQGVLKVGIVRDPDNLFLVLIQAPPPR
jgi:catechol 2,3-dioxygenase-like lactoylglutathione lyase family enzyme